jgi:hypothetical protein
MIQPMLFILFAVYIVLSAIYMPETEDKDDRYQKVMNARPNILRAQDPLDSQYAPRCKHGVDGLDCYTCYPFPGSKNDPYKEHHDNWDRTQKSYRVLPEFCEHREARCTYCLRIVNNK